MIIFPQLKHTLETKLVEGLYFGQIKWFYEEAASGLMLELMHICAKKGTFNFKRDEAYIEYY
jgi:tRNA U34 5-carboxymethylaminomethyl modifying enzyme MnmG/GidA